MVLEDDRRCKMGKITHREAIAKVADKKGILQDKVVFLKKKGKSGGVIWCFDMREDGFMKQEQIRGVGHVHKRGKKLKGGEVGGEGESSELLMTGPGECVVLLVTTEHAFMGSGVIMGTGEILAVASDIPASAELDVASDGDEVTIPSTQENCQAIFEDCMHAVREEVAPSSTDEANGRGRVPTAAFPKGRCQLPFTESQPRPGSCQALRVICSTHEFSKGIREGKAPQCQMASLTVADMHVQLGLLILMLIMLSIVCEWVSIVVFPHADLQFKQGRE